MNILYVQRAYPTVKKSILSRWVPLRRRRVFEGQDGFFEGSLCVAFPDVHWITLEEAIAMRSDIDKHYDWIIFNMKCDILPKGPGRGPVRYEKISWLKTLSKCRKGLFVNNAKATTLPDLKILSLFDVIFKRELLKDIALYQLPESVRLRLHTTMLSCPLVETYWCSRKRVVIHLPRGGLSSTPRYDVSFVGADSNLDRRTIIKSLVHKKFSFYGGLYMRGSGDPLDWDGPSCRRLKSRQYIQSIRNSKIHLALDGIGGFTFRHLDVWCLGGFLLSTPAINEVQLPGYSPEEGVHYVTFRSKKEMTEKILYYLSHDEERLEICRAGRSYFQQLYDFEKHSREIRSILE